MNICDFKFKDSNDVEISGRVYGRFGYAWEDRSMGRPVTQVQLQQTVPFNIVHGVSGEVLQQWGRYPQDSRENGYCVYIMVDSPLEGLHRSITSMLGAGMLTEMYSGPAVLDIPVVSAKTAWWCDHGAGLADKRERAVASRDMYADAIANFASIRAFIDEAHPWYSKLLGEEHAGFSNAASY